MAPNPFSEGIGVRITASTAGFKASMKSAQRTVGEFGDETTSAAGKVSLLGNRVDNTADQFGQLARRAFMAGGAVSAVGAATATASGAFSVASTVLSASVLPALAALATTIGPIVATLGAAAAAAGSLAAAFGAVMGTGVLAYGEQLTQQAKQRIKQLDKEIKQLRSVRQEKGKLSETQKKRLEQLQKEKRELISQTSLYGALAAKLQPARKALEEVAMEIGQQFIPLIRDAINALPQLIRNVGDAIGPLGGFAKSLRRLGGMAMEIIPQIVGGMMDLARKALPVFNKFVSFIANNGASAFNLLRSTAEKLWPAFRKIGSALVNLLPQLFKIGTAIAERVLPAAGKLIQGLSGLLQWFQQIFPTVKAAVLPAFQTIQQILTQAVAWWHNHKQQVMTAIQTLMQTVRQGLAKARQVFQTVILPILTRASSWWQNHQGQVQRIIQKVRTIVQKALNLMSQTFQNVILPILQRAAQWWNQHKDQVLRVLNKLATIVNHILSFIEGLWQAWGDEIMTIVKVVSDVVFGTLSLLLDGIETAIDITLAAINGNWSKVWKEVSQFFERTMNGILSFIKDWGGKLLDWLGGFVGDVLQWFKDLAHDLIGGSIIPDMLSDIKNEFLDWVGDMKNAGEALINGVVRGIRNKIDDVKRAAKNVAQKVDDFLPGSDAKRGPLSNLTDMGQALPETFAKGIESNRRPVEQASGLMAGRATPAGGGNTSLSVDEQAIGRAMAQELNRQGGSGQTVIEVDGREFARLTEETTDQYLASREIRF